MPQVHVHKKRWYTLNGRRTETVTMCVKTVSRVRKVPDRLDAGVRGPGSTKRQSSRGQVYGWAATDTVCGCVRLCHEEYTIDRVDDDNVKEARKPLYDTTLTKPELRAELKKNWRELLVMPDEKPVCLTMATRIFACSRSKLFPDTNRAKRSRAEANSHRGTKSVSIASWFEALKRIVDIMPDHGWYQLPQARKKHLWAQYKDDCRANPTMYTLCKSSLFYAVWREQFSQFRLRKHCRFSKCTFCVDHRNILYSPTESQDAKLRSKDLLRQHYQWANTRERGVWHSKRVEANESPDKVLVVSLDGTDQFPHGVPHFREHTKKEGNSVRQKLSMQIALVEGQPPIFYLAWEHLYGDPNWTIETLYRQLKAEETRRGGKLPPTCYLQLDNCIRENKNTYVVCWLAWLVERGAFNQIFLSFLPVGHTHFINDQVASRVSLSTKHTDITSVEKLEEVLTNCYSPRPNVEWVEDVADVRGLFNPKRGVRADGKQKKNHTFPKKTSRVLVQNNIATGIHSHTHTHTLTHSHTRAHNKIHTYTHMHAHHTQLLTTPPKRSWPGRRHCTGGSARRQRAKHTCSRSSPAMTPCGQRCQRSGLRRLRAPTAARS
jgi:hypothetical protein